MRNLLFFIIALIGSVSAQDPLPPAVETKQQEHLSEPTTELFNATSPDQFEAAFKRMLLALGLILTLTILTIWMFKRVAKGRLVQGNRMSDIKILEKRALNPKTTLYLIQVGDQQVLLSESHLEVTKLKTFYSQMDDAKKQIDE